MIVFIGPASEPITGQSLSFDISSRYYNGTKKIFYYGIKSKNKILILWSSLSVFFKFSLCLLFCRDVSVIYLTTSRSPLGFFRDSMFILTAKLFSIKVVNHLHGADFKDFRSSQHHFLQKFIDFVYRRINTSIVLLPKMKEQYDAYENMDVVSISNCALPFNYRFKNESSYLKVLYLSNVMYSKGVLTLIEAVENLTKLGVDIELYIAGLPMGDDYLDLVEIDMEFRKAIKGKQYIKYLGSVSGTKKEQILIDSDVFVLPSFYKTEAQPISIIEAMMAGSAIITTKHNYLEDIVTSDNGYLVDTQCAKGIEAALLDCIDNPKKLKDICQYNKTFAKENYSLKKYIDEIKNVLED